MLSACNQAQNEAPRVSVEGTAGTSSAAQTEALTDSPGQTIQTEPPSAEDIANAQALREYLKANFPIIDGSTSTLPMDAAIRSAIFGTSLEDEEETVYHSTTYYAFDRIAPYDDPDALANAVDVLLSVKMTQADLDAAKARGADLVITPVAKEAFVFLVNKANPVDSISQDDLRKIYSGEITNWKELGGDDAPIKAFQRNTDSGSQTAMVDFMGDVPLTAAEKTVVVEGMGSLADGIADFDSGRYAIGYNMYSYTTKQYVNFADIKLIAVDGVNPADETLADGSYPIVNYTYTFYDNNRESSKEKGGKLTEWLLTADGQQVIADAGYVNLSGEKANLPETVLYSASGSGITQPENYKPVNTYYGMGFNHFFGGANVPVILNKDELQIMDYHWLDQFAYADLFVGDNTALAKGIYPELTLSDTAVAGKINADMKTMVQRLEGQYDNFYEYLGNHSGLRGAFGFEINKLVDDPEAWNGRPSASSGVSAEFNIKNGYFSVFFSLTSMLDAMDTIAFYYDYETAVYNLYTGEKLAFSDLFFEGTDFLKDANAATERKLTDPATTRYSQRTLESAFAGLEEGRFGFTLNSIILDKSSDYISETTELYIDYPMEIYAPQIPDNMAGLFPATDFNRIDPLLQAGNHQGSAGLSCRIFNKGVMPEADRLRINGFIEEFTNGEEARAVFDELIAEFQLDPNEPQSEDIIDSLELYITAEYFTGSDVLKLYAGVFMQGRYRELYFDSVTLQPLTMSDLAAPGYQAVATIYDIEQYSLPMPEDLTFEAITSIYTMDNFTVMGSNGRQYSVSLPKEYALRLPENYTK
jgi:phosphate transport system substrate-binding protein